MKNRIITILVTSLLIGTIFPLFLLPSASSGLVNPSSLIVHDSIYINANNKFISGNGVLRGNGTLGNPYIIENWSIEANNDNGIWIRDTDVYFIIRNCYVHNATKSWPYRSGIYFNNVKNGKIENNWIKNNYNGIYLFNSNQNSIINNSIENNLYGITLDNSAKNTILNNFCNSNSNYGIFLRYSSNDNKILNNNCTLNNDAGIFIEENSIYNIISANTCTRNKYSGILIDSNENTIKNNICISNTHCGITIYDTSNIVENNTCTLNNDDGISIGGNSNTIINNTCALNQNAGISITSAKDNIFSNNTCISNNEDGIYLEDSKYNDISNNICDSNSKYGIVLKWSSGNNVLFKNTCNKNWAGIESYWSDSNMIKNNNLNLNDIGIQLSSSTTNILLDNTMIQCGILINGDLLNHWNTHNIEITNTVNGEPVFYWKDVSGGTIPSGAGEVILANCSNVKIYDQHLTKASAGILLGFTSNSLVDKNFCSENRYYGIYLSNSYNNRFTNTTCTFNYDYGMYFYSSWKNVIDNCSIILNSNFDLYFSESSENNVGLDTTFNTIDIHDTTSNLIIKNYLHIQANYSQNLPLKDVDIKIKDNNKTVYATPGFGGYKSKTNVDGQIKWVEVTDRIYNGSAKSTENKTTVIVKYNYSMVIDNNREIEMTRSHFEFFHFNILPTKIILNSPLNNSNIKDSTPDLKWTAGFDIEGESITYQVQLDELGDDWTSLVSSKDTSPGILKWNIPKPLRDGNYQWRVNANDGFGNGTWSDVWSFTLDTQPPITAITSPRKNQYYHNLNTISGTVIDPIPSSGVNKVEISIKRLSDNYFLSGSAWSRKETWLVTSGTDEWEYDSSGVLWGSDTQYIIRARGVDNANNMDTPGVDITFTIDADRPVSAINTPLNNTFLNNLSFITGNSLDLGSFGSGIAKVEICIKKLDDNIYWNNNGWGTEEYWLVVKGEIDWTYNANNIFWPTDAYYQIRSRATDNVGNIEHPGQGNTFMFDDKTPKQSITINDGEMYTNSTTVILSLDGEDSGSGISIMAFSPDGKDWSSWEPFINETTYSLPPQDGEKTIHFRVQDLASNIAESAIDTIILDTTPPERLSIAINDNVKYTNSKNVLLTLNAFDLLSGIKGITFSSDGIDWTPWEPFKFTKLISLSSGDGEKIIFFKVIDDAGNIAEPIYDSIIFDTTPPHSLSIAVDKEIKDSEIDPFESGLSLKLNAIDDLSGLDQMSFSYDGKNWTSWEAFSYERDITLPSNDGLLTIYFRVKDRAGNIADPLSYNSTVLENQPTNNSSNNIIYWVLLVIIIIIIVISVITVSKTIINRKINPHQEIPSLTKASPEPLNPSKEEAQENDLTSMEENNTQQTEIITIPKPDLTNAIPPIQEPTSQQQPSIPQENDSMN